MNISGINKFSIVNYPGKVACVLFAKGCPLHCSYCYNKSLLKEPTIPEEEIKNFLIKRKGVLDGVVFSGGEPMAQYKELLSLVKFAKDLNYKIGLHLTGLNSDKKEFEEIVQLSDWIGLDFKAPSYKYEEICGLGWKYFEQALNLIKKLNKAYEIRTTLDTKLTKEDLENMDQFLVENNINEWYLQRLMLEEGEFHLPDFELEFKTKTILR